MNSDWDIYPQLDELDFAVKYIKFGLNEILFIKAHQQTIKEQDLERQTSKRILQDAVNDKIYTALEQVTLLFETI